LKIPNHIYGDGDIAIAKRENIIDKKCNESGKAVRIATNVFLQRESRPESSGVSAVPEDDDRVISTSPSTSPLFLNEFQISPRRPIFLLGVSDHCNTKWFFVLESD